MLAERASYNGSIEASQASDVGSIPIARSMTQLYGPERSITEPSEDIVYTLGPKVFSVDARSGPSARIEPAHASTTEHFLDTGPFF